ncbi:MAG: hypothetical protein QXP01_04890 [Candidatus Hadarchaeum sp.]
MADLLIAVGGTGQHVALAVSRLVFLGALPRMELAVVDADDSRELPTSLRTFGNTVVRGYTEHPLINGDRIYPPFDKAAKQDPKFYELFLTPQSDQLEKDIFDLFFEKDSADHSVKEGMFGCPSVGATIFAHNEKTQLGPVFERANLAEQIFVAGSMVGGTGAGIIHQLVRALHPLPKRIYGLIFLRWFRVPSTEKKGTISDGSMDRNMRYGLDYFFRDTRHLLKASLLIGSPKQPEISMVAGEVGEKKHYYHLVAAYGILRLPRIAVTEETDGSIYASAFEDAAEMYQQKWNDEKQLSWYANRAYFVKTILEYAITPRFRKEILGSFSFLGNPKNIGEGLYGTIQRYNKPQRERVVDEFIKTWQHLVKQYEFSLTWLDEVLKPLPQNLYHPRYAKVRDNDDEKVAEIQRIWREAPPVEEHLLGSLESSPEVARKFHDLLVKSFE